MTKLFINNVSTMSNLHPIDFKGVIWHNITTQTTTRNWEHTSNKIYGIAQQLLDPQTSFQPESKESMFHQLDKQTQNSSWFFPSRVWLMSHFQNFSTLVVTKMETYSHKIKGFWHVTWVWLCTQIWTLFEHWSGWWEE
jgi:hypothetical protein